MPICDLCLFVVYMCGHSSVISKLFILFCKHNRYVGYSEDGGIFLASHSNDCFYCGVDEKVDLVMMLCCRHRSVLFMINVIIYNSHEWDTCKLWISPPSRQTHVIRSMKSVRADIRHGEC